MCKVTVYMPCYNYGQFVKQAVASVFKQTMGDWELIIINDGSTDNTLDIISKYKEYGNVRIIDQENKGLNVTNNIALRLANGDYIMRLDADDYLDENALLVMSSMLDSKPEISLVYPDYYHVDENGNIIEAIRRDKIEEEVRILDLPAHGACTMFRKEVLLQLGGYVEEFSCQDGYELWLRFISRFKPYNVNVPLFYYRQHAESLTKDMNKVLETRRRIKRRFVEQELNGAIPKVLGIIPVVGKSVYVEGSPFETLGGRPLIWHTLNEAGLTKNLDRIVVSSEDDEVLEFAAKVPRIEVVKREREWSKAIFRIQDFLKYLLEKLKKLDQYEPDAVCTLYITTPLRRHYHIDKAVDTMAIFGVDSVVSVQEELARVYQHQQFGLTPINNSRNGMRLERDAIYKENSSIFLSKVSVLESGRLIGDRVGHITMLPEESIKITSKYDLWLAEKILSEWMKNDTNC